MRASQLVRSTAVGLAPRTGDPASWIVAKVLLWLLGVLLVAGAGYIAWFLFTIPRVPDRLVPDPDGALVVGDWTRPGAEDGYGAHRDIAFVSPTLGDDALLDAIADDLRRSGWQLEGGDDPQEHTTWQSTELLEGEYDVLVYLVEDPPTPPPGSNGD